MYQRPVPAGTTVKLTEDYLVNGDCGLQIDPANKNITFDLNGFALKPGDDFTPNTENGVNNWRANLVSINGADGFTPVSYTHLKAIHSRRQVWNL